MSQHKPASPASSAPSGSGAGTDGQRAVADEIAGRLRRNGVNLTGRETPDELVRLLEAVERFEAAVRRGGGDLMVDVPVDGAVPTDPDDRAFVLPRRGNQEPIVEFLSRISEATERAGKRKPPV